MSVNIALFFFLLLIKSRHAGRDTVDVKDVLLLVRRNEQLKEVLEEALKDIKK